MGQPLLKEIRLERSKQWLGSQQRNRNFTIAGWTLLGVGVVVGGLAGTFHGLASSSFSAVSDPSDFSASNFEQEVVRLDRYRGGDDSYETLVASGNQSRLLAHIFTVVGAAALGSGATLLLIRPSIPSGAGSKYSKQANSSILVSSE